MLLGEPQQINPEEVKRILLSWVKDDLLRMKVSEVLSEVWEVFYKIPASKTGRYHPKECNVVPYGLINHTFRTLWLAKLLCEWENLDNEKINKVMAAAVIHDVGKCWRHPPLAKDGVYVDHGEKGAEIAAKYGLPLDIVNMIRVHMSIYEGKKIETVSERVLAQADFLASRKEIKILTWMASVR